ncbi:similar to Saccharomyces cerevisiae YBR259W Putative protein of unknown function [Maudiozyma saulgeensis]|uniref:Uncharacterized protein n=1 Tax=Maudiozyma saulgeensis TaxID=1789683 RepID=A0A1X7R180_9SACH|nr:similar to Saccharomyces cerevisiae YBR259W Putative protein of unknown function [Kazachstania saulgeensis]
MDENDYLLNLWTTTAENLFFDEEIDHYFIHLQKLRFLSIQLNNEFDFDSHLLKIVIDLLLPILKRYANSLSSNSIQSIEKALNISHVLCDLENDILIYFSDDRSVLETAIKQINKVFFTTLCLNISVVWKVILIKILKYDIKTIHSTLPDYAHFITEIESFQLCNGKDVILESINALKLAINNIIDTMIENCDNSSADFLIKILKIQLIQHLTYGIYQFNEKETSSGLLTFLTKGQNGNTPLISLFRDLKLTDGTLSVLYDFYKMNNNCGQFLTDMLKYRSVSFENDDWNQLLNQIDLFDPFEISTSHGDNRMDKEEFEQGNFLRGFDTELDLRNSQKNSILNNKDIEDRISCESGIIVRYKQTIRNHFKISITNEKHFHEYLLNVIDSYYDIILENKMGEGVCRKYISTMRALLTLVLNYTPNLELFIKYYYAPKLLKRIITYQNVWIHNFNTSENFDRTLINMLPKEIKSPLVNITREFILQFNNPEHWEKPDCEFSGVYLKGSEYSFSLPTMKPVFPNEEFRNKWTHVLSGIDRNSSAKTLDQSIHIIEMSSPFIDATGRQVTIVLPITLASILYCFNEVDIRDISDIKKILNIKKSEEKQIVRGLKTLLKHNLLVKINSTFKLSIYPIPIEALDKDAILRIV